MTAPPVLITGASGFIGGRLLSRLAADGVPCRTLSRRALPGGSWVRGDLSFPHTLVPACDGVATVFHCAGYAHAFSSLSGSDAETHWRVNFEGTRALAEAAGQAGVRHFVFLSSVKAMAEPGDCCVNEDHPGPPVSEYGKAKRAAEEALREAGLRYGMQVVNLRLAMVYGSGGRGNLQRMGKLVRRGWFPPLPETGNRRSLVHVDDVVSAMCLVTRDERASGRTYIVAGPEAPSGRQLFDALRTACGLPACAWSVPLPLLRAMATVGDIVERAGHRRMPLDSEALDRLLGSACYSAAHIERETGWRARVGLAEGLAETMRI